MSREDIVYLMMILNVNRSANVIILNVPYALMKVKIGVNERETYQWIFSENEQQNVYLGGYTVVEKHCKYFLAIRIQLTK